MILLKYPVITKEGEYQVKVYEKYIACGITGYEADVQIPCKLLFRKFKTVFNVSLWEDNFEREYNFNFIKYAKDAVLKYEDSIKEQLRKKKTLNDNLKAWDKWDGVIE